MSSKLAENIKILRKEKKISQLELGSILGISQQAIGKWEKSIAEPDSQSILKMSNLFNVTTDYLLGNTDNPNIESTSPVSPPPPAPNTVIAFGRGGERKEFTLNDDEAAAVTAMLEALRPKKNQ